MTASSTPLTSRISNRVWSDDLSDGVKAQPFKTHGGRLERRDAPTVTPVGLEFRVNTFTTNTQAVPAIAMDADGDSVVVWESLRDGSGFGIYGQRYDKSGAPVGTEFLVNNVTTNDQRSPSVAMDATGGFVVVFESFGQDGSSYGVYARRFNTGPHKEVHFSSTPPPPTTSFGRQSPWTQTATLSSPGKVTATATGPALTFNGFLTLGPRWG